MVCMCVKRDAKEAESRAGRGERCRPRIRLRGDSVWMAVVRRCMQHMLLKIYRLRRRSAPHPDSSNCGCLQARQTASSAVLRGPIHVIKLLG